MKYLILGGLSSAFLVMGVAYIFGVMGTTRFDLLANVFHGGVPVVVGVADFVEAVLPPVGAVGICSQQALEVFTLGALRIVQGTAKAGVFTPTGSHPGQVGDAGG